jgi:hypothetical protein
VSSGANATPVGAWLYWNDDYSGWNWNVPANSWNATLKGGTQNMNDAARSVWNH